MDAQFEFYEQVRISGAKDSKSHLNGRFGVVVGRTETEGSDSWYYAVDVDGEVECWCCFEGELEATGVRFTRSDFYDGSSIGVNVDEKGRGSVDSANE